MKIRFCGVCHSDLHAIRSSGPFPLVPGHEIVGEVTAIGAAVSTFRVGDAVAIGTIVDSCRSCAACERRLEQYCGKFSTTTYGGTDRHDGSVTRGGYSSELCSLGIPASMDFTPVLLTLGRRRLTSSGVAGTVETQEMLDFCGERGISADVEVIDAAGVDDGFARLEHGDVRYRLVIDMATLAAPTVA